MIRHALVLFLFLLLPPTVSGQPYPGDLDRAAGGAPEFVVIDLGTIGTGPSEALALNNAGEVVGVSETGELSPENYPVSRAVLWLPRPAYGLAPGLHDLGTLRSDPRGSSIALDITDSGQIVGHSENDDFNGFGEPVRTAFSWRSNVLSPLPSPTTTPFVVSATSANDAGELAVTDFAGFSCSPLLWLPEANYGLGAGYHALPPLDGLVEGRAADINSRGEIVGQRLLACDIAGADNGAFLWLPAPAYGLGSGIHNLTPNLAEFVEAGATALNELGQVVGTFLDLDVSFSGFHWSQGTLTHLSFRPLDINDDGWVVGVGDAGAVLWRQGQLHVLADLVDPGSRWQLLRATAINDRGQIAAVGRRQGQVRALLLETALVFTDGFESGDVGAWDEVVPPEVFP